MKIIIEGSAKEIAEALHADAEPQPDGDMVVVPKKELRDLRITQMLFSFMMSDANIRKV